MRRRIQYVLLAAAAAATTSSVVLAEEPRDTPSKKQGVQQPPQAFRVQREPLMQMIETWPEASSKVAKTMIKKYGLPDEATPTLLVWRENGPWKRSIVYKEPVDHNFPVPHKDVLEQFINYDVPPKMADELAMFDGSVYIDRTRGELSAKCDKEVANTLALNLADDIVKGEKSVQEARQAYAEAIKQVMTGKKPEIVSELQFQPPSAQAAGDPDQAVIERPLTGRVEKPAQKPRP